MSKKLLTAEVAAALRTSEDTIRAWVRQGRLRASRVAPRGPLLFDEADVRGALRAARQGHEHDGAGAATDR